MSTEKKIVVEEIIPFRSLLFSELSETERNQAAVVAKQIKERGIKLLGELSDIQFINGIYLMCEDFASVTGYQGAELIVEKWAKDEEGENERIFSLAFYNDLVLSRPSTNTAQWITYEDGLMEVKEGRYPNQCYEVGEEELIGLLELMNECNEETITPRFTPFFQSAK